jgi:hypothetical protein
MTPISLDLTLNQQIGGKATSKVEHEARSANRLLRKGCAPTQEKAPD